MEKGLVEELQLAEVLASDSTRLSLALDFTGCEELSDLHGLALAKSLL